MMFPDTPLDLTPEVLVDPLVQKAEVEWQRRDSNVPPFCDYEILFEALSSADLNFHRHEVYWPDIVRWKANQDERCE